MLDLDEYIHYREHDNLLRYDPAVVARLGISEQAQQFLVEAGLPASVGSYQFDIAPNDLPPLTEVKHRPYLPYDEKCTLDFPAEFERYRVLGISWIDEPRVDRKDIPGGNAGASVFNPRPFDPENIAGVTAFHCLDTLSSGQIVTVTDNLQYRSIARYSCWNVVFSNSRIDLFAAFLCLFKQHEDWERGARLWYDFADYEMLCQIHGAVMEPLFYAVDPPACKEGTSWGEFVFAVSNGITR